MISTPMNPSFCLSGKLHENHRIRNSFFITRAHKIKFYIPKTGCKIDDVSCLILCNPNHWKSEKLTFCNEIIGTIGTNPGFCFKS